MLVTQCLPTPAAHAPARDVGGRALAPAALLHRPVKLRVADLLALTPYRYALLATAWGVCGISWRLHSCPLPGATAFINAPPDALLARIIPPGLAEADLRSTLAHAVPTGPWSGPAAEVLPDPHGRFHVDLVPTWFAELAALLTNYFTTGMRPSFPPAAEAWSVWQPRLDWQALTPFQRQVLELVARIPAGEVLTYGQIATRLRRPGAARAVGAALAANPWPVLIPCHRVVGASGAMTGFSAPGGVTAKRRMLEHERP